MLHITSIYLFIDIPQYISSNSFYVSCSSLNPNWLTEIFVYCNSDIIRAASIMFHYLTTNWYLVRDLYFIGGSSKSNWNKLIANDSQILKRKILHNIIILLLNRMRNTFLSDIGPEARQNMDNICTHRASCTRPHARSHA